MVVVWGLMRAARAQSWAGDVPQVPPSRLQSRQAAWTVRETRHPMSHCSFGQLMTDPSGAPEPPSPHHSSRPAMVASWAETLTTFHSSPQQVTTTSVHPCCQKDCPSRPIFYSLSSPSSQLVYHTVSAVPVLQTFAPTTHSPGRRGELALPGVPRVCPSFVICRPSPGRTGRRHDR